MEVLAQAVMNHVEALPPVQQDILGTMDVDEQLADFDCPVCWNTITEGEKKVKTSCNHNLCADCVPRLQCLLGTTTCVACPMCRTRLQKYAVPEVPLRKVPLHKIRQRLQRQNQIVAGYQHNIEQTPRLINYYMRIIQDAVVNQDRAQRELASAMVYQAELQEEITMRARPRRQPAVSAIV
jgi:hypothetical protein